MSITRSRNGARKRNSSSVVKRWVLRSLRSGKRPRPLPKKVGKAQPPKFRMPEGIRRLRVNPTRNNTFHPRAVKPTAGSDSHPTSTRTEEKTPIANGPTTTEDKTGGTAWMSGRSDDMLIIIQVDIWDGLAVQKVTSLADAPSITPPARDPRAAFHDARSRFGPLFVKVTNRVAPTHTHALVANGHAPIHAGEVRREVTGAIAEECGKPTTLEILERVFVAMENSEGSTTPAKTRVAPELDALMRSLRAPSTRKSVKDRFFIFDGNPSCARMHGIKRKNSSDARNKWRRSPCPLTLPSQRRQR